MNSREISSNKAKQKISMKIREIILQRLLSGSPNLIVSLHDKITLGVVASGVHDRHVVQTIQFLSRELGFNDFFIDVGANIGVISCSLEGSFTRFFCYEPNREVYQILNLNLSNNLLNSKYVTHNCGLDIKAGMKELVIPKSNLGGAFLNSKSNLLSQNALAQKDNLVEISELTHKSRLVEVRSAGSELLDILRCFGEKSKGVIKLDVEGMDITLVNEFLGVLPRSFQICFVFENHLTSENLSRLECSLKRFDFELFKIEQRWPWKQSDKTAWKFLKSLIGETQVILTKRDIKDQLEKGDYVLIVYTNEA